MTRFVLFFLLLLGGCAAKKLVVKNADTLILFEANQYLGLHGEEKKVLEKNIDSFLTEVQLKVKEILPGLQLKKSQSLQETLVSYQRIESLLKNVFDDFTLRSSVHLSQLSSPQQKEFLAVLKKKNLKIKERTLKSSQDKIFDRFQNVLGNLTDDQKSLILQFKDYFQLRHQERIKRREKLALDFDLLFSQMSDASTLKLKIHSLLTSYHASSWEGHKNQEIIEKIYPTLSQKQFQHLNEKKAELDDLLHYFIKVQY